MPSIKRLLSFETLVLCSILLVGGLLRFSRLDLYQDGFSGHSLSHLNFSLYYFHTLFPEVIRLNAQAAHELLASVVMERAGPFALINALGMYIFGTGLEQYRMTQALLGTINIFLGYILGCEIQSKRLGLILAALIATSPWHINQSRYDDAEHIIAPMHFLLISIYALKAKRRGSLLPYSILGFLLGLTWYTYASNLALLPVILVAFLLETKGSPSYLKQRLVPLLGLAISFLLASLPQLYFGPFRTGLLRSLIRQPHSFSESLIFRDGFGAALHAFFCELFINSTDEWYAKAGGGLGITEIVFLPLVIFFFFYKMKGMRFSFAACYFGLIALLSPLLGILGPHPSFRRIMLLALVLQVTTAYVISYCAGSRKYFVRFATCAALLICLPIDVYSYFTKVETPEVRGHLFERLAAQRVAERGAPFIICIVADQQKQSINNLLHLISGLEYSKDLPLEMKPAFMNPDQLQDLKSTTGISSIVMHPECALKLKHSHAYEEWRVREEIHFYDQKGRLAMTSWEM